jgi:hypothetical protein
MLIFLFNLITTNTFLFVLGITVRSIQVSPQEITFIFVIRLMPGFISFQFVVTFNITRKRLVVGIYLVVCELLHVPPVGVSFIGSEEDDRKQTFVIRY